MLKLFVAVLLTVCLFASCRAAEPAMPAPGTAPAPAAKTKKPKVSVSSAVKSTGAAKTAASPPAKPASAAKSASKPASASKNALRTEAEISGMTSETSDQVHGRLSLSRMTPERKWWVRTGGGLTTSRTFTKTKTHENDVTSFNFDAEYRHDGKGTYRFVSGVANLKNRTPHASAYYDKAGYYMLSAGYGKTIWPGMDFEVALAHITQQRNDTESRFTPVYSLRMRAPLSSAMTLDSDTHLVQPWTEDSLIDSRVNLSYRLTSALSMRLTYVANNILGTNLTRATEWDKSFRISLVFSGGGN